MASSSKIIMSQHHTSKNTNQHHTSNNTSQQWPSLCRMYSFTCYINQLIDIVYEPLRMYKLNLVHIKKTQFLTLATKGHHPCSVKLFYLFGFKKRHQYKFMTQNRTLSLPVGVIILGKER
jgi:hypothetical protein